MVLGSIAGYFGGWLDESSAGSIDILLAFPGFCWRLRWSPCSARASTNVRHGADGDRVGRVRAPRPRAGAAAREFEFVQAARALGASTPRILFRHVIPTTMPAVMVQATLGMAGAILGGGVAELSRPRRSAADAELGHDAERGPAPSARCAASDHLSGRRDRRCWCLASIFSEMACATLLDPKRYRA